ncbi:MAG: hypothetical protein RLZZ268_1168, partial [Cyanobacteriota bacterium]|jgi:hypothetical protein
VLVLVVVIGKRDRNAVDCSAECRCRLTPR